MFLLGAAAIDYYSNTVVTTYFEWNEDYIYGPHYHVMLPIHNNKHIIKDHYKPGDSIPEPWNTIYFNGYIKQLEYSKNIFAN